MVIKAPPEAKLRVPDPSKVCNKKADFGHSRNNYVFHWIWEKNAILAHPGAIRIMAIPLLI